MSTEHGWYANWDKDAEAFQPILQTKSGTVTSLEIWFKEEAACDDFIREEVVGENFYDKPAIVDESAAVWQVWQNRHVIATCSNEDTADHLIQLDQERYPGPRNSDAYLTKRKVELVTWEGKP